jgi:hypothetical protein
MTYHPRVWVPCPDPEDHEPHEQHDTYWGLWSACLGSPVRSIEEATPVLDTKRVSTPTQED